MLETHNWPDVLAALLADEDLSVSAAAWAMDGIVSGSATDAQIAAFLVALRAKGETVDEIVGFRDSVLEHSIPLQVNPMALDIVGTGGDRYGTVNISTTSAIICAALGVPVVKHGNRAASSASGASDVLAALGLKLSLDADQVAKLVEQVGITFVFAAAFHPGFKNVAPIRAQIGVPTVFNFLGPMCNPARPEASAVGVAQLDRVPLFTGLFQTRGATALVFRGDDGLDELTTTGHSRIWEVSRGTVKEHDLDPRDLGLQRARIDDLIGGTPEHNAAVLRDVLAGASGPVRDIVALNAAAGLVAFKLAAEPNQIEESLISRFSSAIELALSAIDSGAASAKLDEWISASHAV